VVKPHAAQGRLDRRRGGSGLRGVDLPELKGQWSLDRAVRSGEYLFPRPRSGVGDLLSVQKDRFTLELDAELKVSGHILGNPGADPKTVTLKIETIRCLVDGKVTGRRAGLLAMRRPGDVLEGIYTLRNRRLTLCLALSPGAARPADFTAGPGAGRALLYCNWTRVIMIRTLPARRAVRPGQ
jgi:uncharacterized protein (TIGR03067 family)